MKYLLLFIATALSAGCNENNLGDVERITPGTYVLSYDSIRTISAYPDITKRLWLYENPAPTTSSIVFTTQSDKFKALSAKHGDKDFPYDILVGRGGSQNEYFAHDFTTVEVISNQDFDEKHPAGSSLKDIVRIYSVSPAKYVKSGYKETFDWTSYPNYRLFQVYWEQALQGNDDMTHITYGSNKLAPIDYLLSELPKDALILLGRGEILDQYRREPLASPPFAVLKFEQRPTQNMEHLFTITVTDDNGNKIEAKSVGVTW